MVCSACRQAYTASEPRWRCDCGGLLDLDFQPEFNRERIAARPADMWRYMEALPVQPQSAIRFGEGFTPLLSLDFAGRQVWIKQDQLFSSGSYKDRGAAVMISKVRQLGIADVVEDSSGNAGCAVAAYCARAGINCEIFVPAGNSPGKLAQIRLYGAKLNQVPGSREDTASAVWEAAQARYYASHVWNPYFFHGTKTWAYEVVEQLGWQPPDTVVLPAGNGTLLLGAAIGFKELHTAGIIARIPRLVAVQSGNCAPLVKAFQEGRTKPVPVQTAETLAEGIAIVLPARGAQILQAVRESSGTFIAVEEAEILAALKRVLALGYYIEPTSAAVIAGLLKYLPSASAGERIVSVFTGHGLKATEKLLKLSL